MMKSALAPMRRLFASRPLPAAPALLAARARAPRCLRPLATAAGEGPPAIQFVLGRYRPRRSLSFRGWRQISRVPSQVNQVEVDVMCEGAVSACGAEELQDLQDALAEDAQEVVRLALALRAQDDPGYKLPRNANLSMVMCDDAYIRSLNQQYRGKDYATDVLSFEMPDEMDHKIHLPVKLLGDLVISLDTAGRQAAERGYGLLDEARVLLVHGVLHLCGYDHERGPEALMTMARAEQSILAALGWQGAGLISAAGADVHDGEEAGDGEEEEERQQQQQEQEQEREPAPGALSSEAAGSSGSSAYAQDRTSDGASTSGSDSSSSSYVYRSSDIELVAIDMDGTFLDSRSRVRPSAAKAVRAALDLGIRVVLATGKARPAAIKACETVGLAGGGWRGAQPGCCWCAWAAGAAGSGVLCLAACCLQCRHWP